MRISILGLIAIALLAIVAVATSSAQSPRSVWDGVYTVEQAKRGATFYGQECSQCHGSDMSGSDEVPPLSGDRFMSNWNTLSVGDLLERIRISMPAGDPSRLSPQEKADIVAFVLNANKFPAGTAELPRESQALQDIQILATKP